MYVGRFAPSPSGPLHFGSLVAALGSYLDAKAHQGKWLVRVEDVDPPREQPGAAALILQSLEDHHLWWDDQVLYQSHRHSVYQSYLDILIAKQWAYPCQCTRQRLATLGNIYDGYCRNKLIDTSQPHSLRLKAYDLHERNLHAGDIQSKIAFEDLIRGKQEIDMRTHIGDLILKRRDGLYAYSLAVVVDDIAQGITHIIRGSDLLGVTGGQLYLFDLLGAPRPQLGHLPLALDARGQKLSKQNHAKPIKAAGASENLWQALVFLGQNPPDDLASAATQDVIAWGVSHWRRESIP